MHTDMDAIADIEGCPWGFFGLFGVVLLVGTMLQQAVNVFPDIVSPALTNANDQSASVRRHRLVEGVMSLVGLSVAVGQAATQHRTLEWCGWMHMAGVIYPVFLTLLGRNIARTCRSSSSSGNNSKLLPGLAVVVVAEVGRLVSAAAASSISPDGLDLTTVLLLALLLLLKMQASCTHHQKKKKAAKKKRRRKATMSGQHRKNELNDRVADNADDSILDALLGDGEGEENDETVDEAARHSPLDKAGLFSRLAFSWVAPLLRTGAKRQLHFDDIPPLAHGDDTSFWAHRFQDALDAERDSASQARRRPSLLRVANVTFGAEYFNLAGLQLFNDLLGLTGPILLKLVVTFVQDFTAGTAALSHGYALFVVLLVCYGAAAVLSTQYSLRMSRVQLHVRTALITAIYRQLLQCRAAQLGSGGGEGLKEKRENGGENIKEETKDKPDGGGATTQKSPPTSTGGITNLMTVDVQRIQDAASSFNTLWSLPLQVGLTLFLLYREVSYAFIAGLVVLATMVPINAAIARAITRVSQRQMKYKDSRVQACDEMLHGIRTLKLLAWEHHLARLLGRLRGKEVQYLAQRKYLDAWCVYFWAATPVVTSLVTFVAVVQLEHTITPAAVFTTIALLNMLIFPMNAFPWVINGLMEARVSKGRLERFLLEMPRPPGYVVMGGEKEDGTGEDGRNGKGAEQGEVRGQVIGIEAHGSFAWDGCLYSSIGEGEKEQQHNGCKQEREAAMPMTERLVDIEELEEGVGLVEASFSSTATPTAPPSGAATNITTISSSSPFELPNLHFRVAQGEIVGIYGKIGAGKSTLLAALLGEVYASPGSRVVLPASRRAYVAQSPWLQRGSIRDNIVFGQPWDGARFERVLEVCALLPDLATISGGAQAEIGERGGTLSGGQRLRVALARALYSRAELYLLDDPFSGLDTRTARHVAREAVFGMMRQEGATVLLVTHALPLLEGCDWAVAMQGGRVVEKIRFKPRTEMKKMMRKMVEDREGGASSEQVHGQVMSLSPLKPHPPPASSPPASSALDLASELLAASTPAPAPPTALTHEETREEGHVKWGVVSYYMNSTGRILSAALLTCLLGMQISTNAFTYWLSLWSSHTDEYSPNDFLLISGTIAALNSAFILTRSFLFAYGGLRAARLLHDQLLRAVLGASIVFFDAHPVGRILNRFAQDTYTIDDSLPFMLNIFLAQAFGLFGTAVILLLASPWSVLVLLVVAVVYQRLQIFYRASSRELKRLDSVSRSPVFAHFSETMDGATTIRAFGATDAFLSRSLLLVDANQRVGFAGSAASQWLGLRLQAFGVLVVASVAAWAVGSCVIDHPVSAGLIGLSLSYTLPLVGNLSGLLSAYSETEKEMVAVERVHEFTAEPPEPDVVTLGGEKQGEAEMEVEVPPSWPSAGRIVVQGLSLRYRPAWPLALDRVNLTIQAGEKIGVCGRTGSGKTTLLSTLFRLVPWQHGAIFIDGLPIHRVPLQRLRASLAVIPQSPTLFAGSVRSNLDPTGAHSDAELGAAMKTCHLDVIFRRGAVDSAKNVPVQNKKEETPSSSSSWSWAECLAVKVQEKGQNFSVGERQLLCLCRVLLRRTPIVCVDEASASLDVATDALLRRTLANAFKHATVITIAHRMSTVLELCERVVVLSEGRVVEDGNPQLLVRESNTFLARLAAQERIGENEKAMVK